MACRRSKLPVVDKVAKEIKQSTTIKTTVCSLPCGYFGNEKLDGEKVLCPKCGMGVLQPFTANNE
jgi:hypothetical protein